MQLIIDLNSGNVFCSFVQLAEVLKVKINKYTHTHTHTHTHTNTRNDKHTLVRKIYIKIPTMPLSRNKHHYYHDKYKCY